MTRVMVISPPFASHAEPMARLATAMAARGVDVLFACAPDFSGLADDAGLTFVPLTFGDGANTGVAQRTQQSSRAAERLAEFLEATRHGAVPALLAQAAHRREDMLSAPEETLNAVRELDERYRPDWYLVDQLAYAVTLALYCLDRPWASFCPGHPSYVVSAADRFFGEPAYWPDAVRPGAEELADLRKAVQLNDETFTGLFDDFVRTHAPHRPSPGRAFGLTSPHAVVFNYPPLPWLPGLPGGPVKIFLGHCAAAGQETPSLSASWRDLIARLTDQGRRRLVVVSFGTFLSARDDVLLVVVEGLLRLEGVAVLVSAGARVPELQDLAGRDEVVIAGTIPQRALLQCTDLLVHHGGNNSFTEALAAGVPALVLPFSSDQFAVAHDLDRAGAGICADPRGLTSGRIAELAGQLLDTRPRAFTELVDSVRSRGPAAAVPDLLKVMGEASSDRATCQANQDPLEN